jgi:hypothetical protein
VWRWLAADPRDVVDLAGAGALAGGSDGPALGEELQRWRRIVARRRLIALVRRHGAVALGLAAALEILAQLDAIPQWVVVAVPLATFLVSVTAFALRGPSPFGLARLLDDKLGLNDRLATALEIEARGGGETPLERRTCADAAGLLRAGRDDWHASTAPGGRDWWALAGPVAALAIVVAIGAASGGGSSSSAQEALAGGGGAGGGPNEHHRGKGSEKGRKQLAPTGKLHKFKGTPRKPTEASQVEASEEGYRQIPQGSKSGEETKRATAAKPAGKGNGKGAGKAPTGKIHEGSGSPKAKPGESASGKKSSSAKGNKESEHPSVGFNVKGQKNHGHGRPGNSEVSGAGAKKAAPNGQGDETSSSTQSGTPKSGTPSGAGKAGGERGTNTPVEAKPISGEASKAVKIQPGYAPSRSTKGGTEHHKAGDSQGAGGKARTAEVTGATQVGDQFSYVPAAGGAVPPGPSAGLQLNYLESLKWVQRLPW